jgi:acyl-CoA thioesterase FadM
VTGQPLTETASEILTHEATYRVRFDEAGPDGLLRTSGLLRYAQDVAWLHSTARGFDRDWYTQRELTWLVRAAELEVLAPVPLGTTLLSRTAVVSQRRVWARRRGEFILPDGSLAGWVHTDWVMIDGRGGLTRIPAIFAEEFKIPESTAAMARVALPPTPADTGGSPSGRTSSTRWIMPTTPSTSTGWRKRSWRPGARPRSSRRCPAAIASNMRRPPTRAQSSTTPSGGATTARRGRTGCRAAGERTCSGQR